MAAGVVHATVYKSRGEWLESRDDYHVGASEVAAVLGYSPWDTPMDLWLRKSGIEPPPEQTFQMRFGQLIEPVIISLFKEEHPEEVELEEPYTIFRHEAYPGMGATPDAWFMDVEGKTLQLKSTSEMHQSQWDEGIPIHYRVQCEWEATLCGATSYACVCLIGNKGLVRYDHEVNTKFIEASWPVVKKFLEDVKNGDRPDAVAKDLKMLRRHHFVEEDQARRLTFSEETMLSQHWDTYEFQKMEVARHQKVVDEAEVAIRNMFEEGNQYLVGSQHQYKMSAKQKRLSRKEI